MNRLSVYMEDINKLCSAYSVKHLYAVGSILTDQYHSKSDIDFIVDFLPINSAEYADNYYDLKFSLERVLNRKVDLLEEKAIRNPYFLETINGAKQIVYGK
jgi:predicted nucleotidyltransferase